ncbi:MAG TPA: DUF1214 domain-containing protein [Acidimicrobiales bacterium]
MIDGGTWDGGSAEAPAGADGGTATEAWQELLDALAAAGRTVAALDRPAAAPGGADVDVAEGYRYVLDLLADQLDRAALRDSGRPLFLPGVTPVRKLFFDNPDAAYDTALITGDRTYRITGTRGTVTYLSFCVYAGGPVEGTRVTNLADADMAFGPDGSFELTLSPDEPPGPPGGGPSGTNWIRLDPDAHTVIARQYVLDPGREQPAHYRIEAVGGRRPDPPLDGARFAALARRTARFVTAATELAVRRAERARSRPNRFVEVPGHGAYGTPDAGYVACWYDLGPDDALVIEARPPRGRYWGVHLANLWGQSLDHRTRTTALNAHTAAADPDGTVRIVVSPTAPDEPGAANWLDTAGHAQGWVLFRWLLADDVVIPDAHVVTRPQPAHREDGDRAARPA